MKTQVKIFILDDNEAQLQVIYRSLSSNTDYDIHTFRRSSDFLSAIDETLDIAIVDYFVDELNGIQITEMIKREYEHVCVIGLSVQSKVEVAALFVEKGAWRYVVINDKSPEKIREYVEQASIQILGDRHFSEEMKQLMRLRKSI